MHNLEDNLINKALMLQTNELDYIVETWLQHIHEKL